MGKVSKPVAKHPPAISGDKLEVWFSHRALVEGCPQVPFVLLNKHHLHLKVTAGVIES